MSDHSLDRRDFFQTLGISSLGAVLAVPFATSAVAAEATKPEQAWKPASGRKIRVGIVGYGVCQFGAAFGFQDHSNVEVDPFTDEISLFQTGEGGTFRMCRTRSIHDLISETGRVFGERGWMDETGYHGAEKELPDTARPPIPPQVPEGGHGGSHGRLTHEFITAILADREPLVNIYEALAMTVPGIIAHQSALKDGETLKVPQFNP